MLLMNYIKQMIALIMSRRRKEIMSSLVMLYVNKFINGGYTNINTVPKLVRAKVVDELEELGYYVLEDGTIVAVEVK